MRRNCRRVLHDNQADILADQDLAAASDKPHFSTLPVKLRVVGCPLLACIDLPRVWAYNTDKRSPHRLSSVICCPELHKGNAEQCEQSLRSRMTFPERWSHTPWILS